MNKKVKFTEKKVKKTGTVPFPIRDRVVAKKVTKKK